VVEGLQSQANASLAQGYTTAGEQFQADQSRMGNLAQLIGQLTGQDADRQLQAGQNEASLAEMTQKLGLNDAAALENIGQSQQAQTQKNYDVAYGDFQAQRDYPKEQLDWINKILNGLPADKTVSDTKSAPLGDEYQPSGLNQLVSSATGIAGLIEALKKSGGT
jgi:hypothetical protein